MHIIYRSKLQTKALANTLACGKMCVIDVPGALTFPMLSIVSAIPGSMETEQTNATVHIPIQPHA
jgi:hypothetical protein